MNQSLKKRNVAHLFDSVQRGSYGYDWHENYGRSIVIILVGTPQDNTEKLEDVERIEDLRVNTRERLVSCTGQQPSFSASKEHADFLTKWLTHVK